jgi:eukaryotic-like serine/threonine-protein kinase
MAKENADRNLLFGIVALQMDFISRDQLVAGLNAWVLRKNDPLAQVLVDSGALAERDRAVLEPMVALHVERHGGDPERSLQATAAELSTRLPSRPVEDAEVIAAMETIVGARGGADVGTIDRPSAGGTGADANAGRAATSAGRFIVLRHHARGGLGNVYVARDTEVNREVALKEIQEQFADDAESRARFLVEAEVTGALEHPGIVPVYGLGRHADGRPFYAMRFIKGDSLKDAI